MQCLGCRSDPGSSQLRLLDLDMSAILNVCCNHIFIPVTLVKAIPVPKIVSEQNNDKIF